MVEKLVPLENQNPSQVQELIASVEEKIREAEDEEEWLEEGENTRLPLLRGLVQYLTEEFLGEPYDKIEELPGLLELADEEMDCDF